MVVMPNADSVNYELAKICQEYGSIMKSVTSDNGAEFSEVGAVLTGVADAESLAWLVL